MAMSFNTLPLIPLNTRYSHDRSSILSSDSSNSKPYSSSPSSTCTTNLPTDTIMQTNTNPFYNNNICANMNNMAFNTCDVDPTPLGHTNNFADNSFSALYGMHNGSNSSLNFAELTNQSNMALYNNTANNSFANNIPFENTQFNSQSNLTSSYQPFGATTSNIYNNGMNNGMNNVQCIAPQRSFTPQCAPPRYNALNPNECTNYDDPSIVSFAPGRPRPGLCCITANDVPCDSTMGNINAQEQNGYENIPYTQSITVANPVAVANNNTAASGGEYVYNSNGDIIGILDGNNVIQNQQGHSSVMRPLVLPHIDTKCDAQTQPIPPPVMNDNNECSFTVMPLATEGQTTPPQNEVILEHKPEIKQVKTITRSTMKRGRHISASEKPFVCETCGKGYKYLCNYRSHCKIHTDDAFVCTFCQKRFGRKSNYKEHVRIHTGEAPYKCQYCDRTFKQHHGWKDHLRVHTGEKPYLCKVCGKRFTVGHNLNVHMRIHTGERPYQCDICKKSYRQKSAYNSHIKNVHGIKLRRKGKGKKVNVY